MDLGLTDKVALVTGSSRGIGNAVARCLLDEGARVVISGRNGTSLSSSLQKLRACYPDDCVHAYQGDLTQPDEIHEYIDTVIALWDRIDIVVANIGSGSGSSFEESLSDEWLRLANINLLSGIRSLTHP